MQENPCVIVRFKRGDYVKYEVEGYESFFHLAKELCCWWGRWISIGSNMVVRKSLIERIEYVSE